jgi:hypothetical protein
MFIEQFRILQNNIYKPLLSIYSSHIDSPEAGERKEIKTVTKERNVE